MEFIKWEILLHMKLLNKFIFIIVFMLITHSAFSVCNFSTASFNATYSTGGGLGEYNPFEEQDSAIQIKFELDNIVGSCSYFIVLSENSATTGAHQFSSGAYNLNYNIYADPAYSKPMLSHVLQNSNGRVGGAVAENIGIDTQFAYIKIPKTQVVPYQANMYSDSLEFDIYQILPDETERYEKSVSLSLKVGVKSVLNFALTDTPNAFEAGMNNKEIGFDFVKNTEIRRMMYFVVQHNTPYDVFLSSNNNMKLVHEENSEFYLNYQFSFNGQVLQLTPEPSNVFSHIKQDVGSGYTIPMEVIVPPQNSPIVGQYKDIIYIMLQAR